MGSIQRVGVTILPQFALTELAVLVTMQKKSPSDLWDILCASRIGDTRLGSNGFDAFENENLVSTQAEVAAQLHAQLRNFFDKPPASSIQPTPADHPGPDQSDWYDLLV